VIVDLAPGFLPPRFDEKPLCLRPSEFRPVLGCTLLILQSCGSLPGGPKVDYFRHLNDRWYPDACAWVGTDPLIKVNYADTVTLDHVEWPRSPVSPSKFPCSYWADFVIQIMFTVKGYIGRMVPRLRESFLVVQHDRVLLLVLIVDFS
jgi:hypothetical protein